MSKQLDCFSYHQGTRNLLLAVLLEKSAKSRSLLLRLLVAENICSCDYSSQTMCFFLCKINRRRECVEAARREISEESLVAPAVTRRRKTVLLRLLVAENICSSGYSSQKHLLAFTSGNKCDPLLLHSVRIRGVFFATDERLSYFDQARHYECK
ncbi:hypothetical protein [Evansella halocellulosilytica]|uniref:hypothetical protein n=1 Tax=Evansella halocellulosilytica TaxID=2011013 RepID=UPI0011558E04|nr:hypothetical protein [Evansella halocellulosilytica]